MHASTTPRPAGSPRHGVNRALHYAEAGKRRQRKVPRVIFGKNSQAGQRPQHAKEVPGMGSDSLGQLVTTFRPVC